MTVVASIVAGAYYKNSGLESFENLTEEQLIDRLASLSDDKLISVCKDVIANSYNETLKDAAIFALSGATDPSAIEKIIKNPNIDDACKSYTINQNALTLKNMIKDNPSEENIALLCEAAKICPSKDFAETLNSVF